MTIEQLAANIAANNAGEQDAISGYYRLLDEARRAGTPQEFLNQVEEIISDEMHHAEVLSAWVTRFTGIKPNLT